LQNPDNTLFPTRKTYQLIVQLLRKKIVHRILLAGLLDQASNSILITTGGSLWNGKHQATLTYVSALKLQCTSTTV